MPRRAVIAAVGAVPATVFGITLSGVLLFADTVSGSPPTSPTLLPGSVPAQYTDDIQAAATRCHGLSPALLAAQLQQESGFNPHAVSPAGAEGIAQFMPATWLAYGSDTDRDGDGTPFDPEDAITAQGRLMCELLRLARESGLGGDPVALALAGYNAGWGAVTQYEGIPPYAETQAYVESILAALPDFEAATLVGEVALPITPGRYTLGAGFGESGELWAADHTGLDFLAPCGTPVVAVTAGTAVISTDEASWAGLHHVKVIAVGGTQSWYAHMSGATINTGQTVRAGQQIGYVGTEGNTTGCHLHLEVHPGGRGPTDPEEWLSRTGWTLAREWRGP